MQALASHTISPSWPYNTKPRGAGGSGDNQNFCKKIKNQLSKKNQLSLSKS